MDKNIWGMYAPVATLCPQYTYNVLVSGQWNTTISVCVCIGMLAYWRICVCSMLSVWTPLASRIKLRILSYVYDLYITVRVCIGVPAAVLAYTRVSRAACMDSLASRIYGACVRVAQ